MEPVSKMLGKDFWEDLDIDLIMLEEDINIRAVQLIKQYGEQLTEKDILSITGRADSIDNSIERAYSERLLSEYKSAGYTPKSNIPPTTVKKSIWQRIYTPVVQLVRTHRS